MKTKENICEQMLRRLACQFALNLEYDGIDLERVDRENKKIPAGCCASQDQCDANVYMASAFEAVLLREIDLQDDDDTAIWNEAWDLVKREGFVKCAKSAEGRPSHDFEASTHTLNPHVIDASRPHADVTKDIVRLIALAIEGTEEYVANDLRKVVKRVYQSHDVLWTLREQLPDCEWFECYERLYNGGLLISVE